MAPKRSGVQLPEQAAGEAPEVNPEEDAGEINLPVPATRKRTLRETFATINYKTADADADEAEEHTEDVSVIAASDARKKKRPEIGSSTQPKTIDHYELENINLKEEIARLKQIDRSKLEIMVAEVVDRKKGKIMEVLENEMEDLKTEVVVEVMNQNQKQD